MDKNYIRIGIVSIQEINPLIGTISQEGNYKHPITFEGITYKIKTGSHRLLLFKSSITCVACGIKGSHYVVEKGPNHTNPHLNLYSEDNILMTRDHIVPKSKGGRNELSNYQVMCVTCNGKKANKLPEEFFNGNK